MLVWKRLELIERKINLNGLNLTAKPAASKWFSPLLLIFGCWLGLITFFATQCVLVAAAPWADAFMHSVTFWLLWGLFMPFVAWLSFKFPLSHERIASSLCVHFVALMVIVGTSQIAYRNFISIHPLPKLLPESIPATVESKPNLSDISETHRNRFVGFHATFDVLIYLAVFAVSRSIANFRRSQEREKQASELAARLAEAKLQALRMQINPHFLFNALNAISTLVHKDPVAADEMIIDLSDFLRSSLESGNEQELPLGREVEFVKHYLAIEQRRFGQRLQVEFSISSDLNTALVPAMILQPLVENAVKHGIEPLREIGVIRIEAHKNGAELELSVSDNGGGPARRTQSEGYGIGLSNTRARLEGLYRSKQSFSINSGPEGGCIAIVRLPFHEQPMLGTPESR